MLTKLTARQYDIEKAEAMLRFVSAFITYLVNISYHFLLLRQSLEWRKLNQVDDILETFQRPEIMTKYYPMGRCGTDKFGNSNSII